MALPRQLFDVRRIYLEPAAAALPRGREVLARFPDAERVEVASHWNIPTLYGNEGSAEDWLKIKREVLVLGVKKGLTMRPNGRSADFIAPSTSNGCAMSCAKTGWKGQWLGRLQGWLAEAMPYCGVRYTF